MLKQVLDRTQMSLCSRRMQGRTTFLPRCVYICSSIDQRRNLVHIAASASDIEWALTEDARLVYVLKRTSTECKELFTFVAAENTSGG